MKARFAGLAAGSGLSESALALRAIHIILQSAAAFPMQQQTKPDRTTDRITIRLRPGDACAVGRRAAMRGMKASTYLAALVRAHLVANPPLPAEELAALKQSVAVLADVNRVLRQLASGSSVGSLREALERTQAAVANVEYFTHDLARAALVSWESRSG